MGRLLAISQRNAYLTSLITVLLLTLAAAPFGQWYLAWIALAPWLTVVGRAPTIRAAFVRGWLTGIVYFALNEWWLWTATIPGTIGVVIFSGFYWGLAGILIRYFRLLPPADDVDAPLDPKVADSVERVACIVGIAVVWVATEWVRCNTVSEFPWLPVGCTQSPAVVMCQIADFAGIWGVSFCLVLANALFATMWLHRRYMKSMWAPCVVTAVVLTMVAAYGTWRLGTTPERIGPKVMLIQSDHPHIPGGASTTTPEQAAGFFLAELEKQLAHEHVDLVILPENEFPPLNDEARHELANTRVGPILEGTYQKLVSIAHKYDAEILVGGAAVTGWATEGKEHVGSEIRNSAYLFEPTSETVARYDKIQLVPFSERLPFATGPRWLTDAMLFLAANRAVQPLHAGVFGDFRPFSLKYWPASSDTATTLSPRTDVKFVAPICLENIDPVMSARMVRDPATGNKRADFFANLSNDGWFHDQEKYQHLQLLVFRCIENRVPMARSSNTGVSGFIDSCGRIVATAKLNQPDVIVGRLNLDERESFYMAFPDVFPISCVIVVSLAILARLLLAVSGKFRASK